MTPGQCLSPSKRKPGRAARRVFGLVLAGLAALATAGLDAHAATPTGKSDRITVSSDAEFAALQEKHRLHTLIRMIQTGRAALAERLLAKYPFTGPLAPNRTLFLNGMIAKARGNLDDAVTSYRAALADNPSLSLVRMELAHTLFLKEEDTGAKHHLEILKSAAPTIQTSKQFDRFIDGIDARRPWAFDAYVSVAPSTNYNNGTSTRMININGVTFSPDNREKSGIGIRGGANGSYRFRLAKDVDLIAGAGINFSEYEGSTFDEFIVSESLTLQKKHLRGSISFGIAASQRWTGEIFDGTHYAGGDEFTWSIGPQISIFHRIAPKWSLFTKLQHRYSEYKTYDYRDGHRISVDNRLAHSLKDGLILYALSGVEREEVNAEIDQLKYWAVSGGLGVYYEAPLGLTLYGEAEVTRKIHDGRSYSNLATNRKDTRVNASLSLHKRDFDIMGVTPQLHYAYIRNFSNSPIDRYETHGANVTLTKKF